MRTLFACVGLFIFFTSVAALANIAPVADFTVIQRTGAGLMKIDLDPSLSQDSDGSIVSYHWDFGDDSTSTVQSPTHSYPNWGWWSVTLTVTDNLGATNSLTKLVDLKDTQIPIISIDNSFHSSNIYVQSLPYSLDFIFTANEPIESVYVNGEWFDTEWNYPLPVTITQTITSAGQKSLRFGMRDFFWNSIVQNFYYWVIVDNQAPVVEVLPHDSFTNKTTVPLSFIITDSAPTVTEVKVNGVIVTNMTSKTPSYSFNLPVVGNNTFEVKSTDAAGNVSAVKTFSIIRDDALPVLSSLVPSDTSIMDRVSFEVSGTSSKQLSEVFLNSTRLTLNSAKTGFSGVYSAITLGSHDLTWKAKDLAGNEVVVSSTIIVQPRLLIPELVSIEPSANGLHLLLIGAKGATRPGAEISASEGLFSWNRGSVNANEDGSFILKMDPFSSVNIVAHDSSTSQSESLTLNYSRGTTLSGLVKDSDDNPLPGVTVRMNGATVVTDGAGLFSIAAPKTGDQLIEFDGSTVSTTITGTTKKFTKTNIVVNIGLGQTNALPRPVYLVPLYLDGTETTIIASSGGSVTSSHAPGVSLAIPSGAAHFPGGGASGNINIKTINSNRSTIEVPRGAVPSKVIALEPSGMQFSERVELTIPNDNELPPGVELVIFSMNSAKGAWEIDGTAKVTTDGQSVKTKPGQGISHFSLVYAVPLAPTMLQASSDSLAGVDVSENSMSTKIVLPSVRVGAADFAPSLTYKSSWANPTAVVSNIIHVPEKRVQASFDQSAGTINDVIKVWGEACFLGICDRREEVIMRKIESTDHINSTVWYQPESIKSQFFVGGVKTDEMAFVNSPEVEPTYTKLPGAIPQQSNASSIIEYSGIPNRALISYAVPLKKNNGDFFDSGVYPSLAKFQIQLKQMSITTGYRSTTVTDNGNTTSLPPGEIPTAYQSRLMHEIFPSDISSTVIVQNKVRSPYGRGWELNTTQKILNPRSQTIVIEEANGELSTYTQDITMNMLYRGMESNTSLDWGTASVKQWPYALVTKYDWSDQSSVLAKVDLRTVHQNNETKNPITIQEIPMNSGEVGNLGWSICPANLSGNFNTTKHKYTVSAIFPTILETPSGAYVAVNRLESSIVKLDGANLTVLAGSSVNPFMPSINMNPNSVGGMMFPLTYWDAGTEVVGTYPCSTASPSNPNRDTLIYSTGSIGSASDYFMEGAGNFGINPQNLGLSNPSDMIVHSDGSYTVADFGNNRVKKFDPGTGGASIVLGNGGTTEGRTDGVGTSLSIYHPRGLALDASGNTYVSTGRGHIRVLRPDGSSSWVAGLPVSDGGVAAADAPARSMSFSDPYGMVFDNDRNFLYVADQGNNRVVRIDFNTGNASTVAGNGTCSSNQPNGGSALQDAFCGPSQLGLDPSGNLIVVTSGSRSIKKVSFNFDSYSNLTFSPTKKDGSKLVKSLDGTWVRTFRDNTKATFSVSGLQQKAVLSNTVEASFTYDSDSRLTSSTDIYGKVTAYNYSGSKLASITDPASRTTYFSYDGDLLTQVSFPDGTNRKFEYDNNGQIVREYNQRNLATTYVYNEHNRLSSVVDSLGVTTQLVDRASQTIPSGNTATLVSSGIAAGMAKDSLTDGTGETLEVSKTFEGFVNGYKDALGRITTIENDENGRVLKIINADQEVTQFTYDPGTGDLLTTTDVDSGAVTANTYNSMGCKTSVTNGENEAVLYTYLSGTCLVATTTYPSGKVLSYTYNDKAQVLTETETIGTVSRVTTNEYNSAGNLVKTIYPSSKYVRFEHDLAGNVTASKVFKTSGVEAITLYEYDLFNRIKKVTSPKNEITAYEYSPTGRLKKSSHSLGGYLQYEFDSVDRVISRTDDQGKSYGYQYDEVGNLKTETSPNGAVKNFTYNAMRKPTSVATPDQMLQFQYNAKDEIIQVKNATTQVDYGYDSRGNVTSSEVTGLGTLSGYPNIEFAYSYDGASRKLSRTSTQGTLTYNYNNDGQLSQLQNSWGDTFVFGYAFGGALNLLQRPGSYSSYDRNMDGQVSGVYHRVGTVNKAYAEYDYDLRNLPTQRRSLAQTANYGYDINGSLISVSGTNVTTETFSYDAIGNRVADVNGPLEFVNPNQQLRSDYKYNYQYDQNGNLTYKQAKNSLNPSFNFSYSSANQLIQVKEVQGVLGPLLRQTDYKYDAIGRRIAKIVWDSTGTSNPQKTYTRYYVYDGDAVAFEYDAAGNLLSRYTHGLQGQDDVLAFSYTAAGVTAGLSTTSGNGYYLKDAIGSVTDIISGSGNIVQSYQYSAFGSVEKIVSSSGVDITSAPVVTTYYAFAGREYDRETGMYFNRARNYDPTVGRFIQQDPHPGVLMMPNTVNSKYIYGNNAPTAYTDPSGKFFVAIGIFALQAILSAVVVTTIQSAIIGGLASAQGGNFFAAFGAAFAGNFVQNLLINVASGGVGHLARAAQLSGNVAGILGGVAGATVGGMYGYNSGGWAGALLGATGGFASGTLGGLSGHSNDFAKAILQVGGAVPARVWNATKDVLKNAIDFFVPQPGDVYCGETCMSIRP